MWLPDDKPVSVSVYCGLTPQQQPGSYQGGEMMMMKSVFWWRKPEYPEETTDLRQVADETSHTYGLYPVRGLNLGRRGVKQSELRLLESSCSVQTFMKSLRLLEALTCSRREDGLSCRHGVNPPLTRSLPMITKPR